MIIVDYRSGAEAAGKPNTVDKLVAHIRRVGVPCEKGTLEYGDAAFEGWGPKGSMMIGVERKTVHDMLHCIDDSRYVAQKVGMRKMYGVSILALEGMWKPHNPDGWLMEMYNSGWFPCRYRSRQVMYSKLYRYLLSVALSGVIVTHSRDLWETAYNICEQYHYFQKRWQDHTSLITPQTHAIQELSGRPSLAHRWAYALTDVGVKYSMEASKLFKTGLKLANSDEMDWMRIKGIGVATAQNIIREIYEK